MNTATPDVRRTPDAAPGRTPTPSPTPAPGPAGYAATAGPRSGPAGRTPWWVWVLIVGCVLAAGGGVAWRIHSVRAAASAGGGGGAGGRRGGAGGHDLPVVVATVRRGDLPVYLYGLGTVTPLATDNLLSRVDGAITQINYAEGQHVKAGDFLVQIDPRPYQAALDQAKGNLTKDTAAKTIADWNVKQDTEALQTKAIAQQQLQTDMAARDTAAGLIEVDQGNIAAAQLNLDYCHITSPIDGQIGLRLVDVGNIVHAAGTTTLAVIEQLQPITVIFTLPEDDLSQLQKRMATGQPVRVDAYDRDLRVRLARGSLLAVDNVIDPTTLTVKVKAKYDNTDSALFPSQAVNARLLVDTIRNAVLVPSAAIQHSPTETFVYVVEGGDPKPAGKPNAKPDARPDGAGNAKGDGKGDEPSGTVKMRAVTVGPALAAVGPDEADTTVVTEGLAAGDVVVTDGVDKLADGTKVRPRMATDRAHGATRPATGPSAGRPPTDETGVGGPAMATPDVGGRPGATGGATTRPFGQHHRHGQPQPSSGD